MSKLRRWQPWEDEYLTSTHGRDIWCQVAALDRSVYAITGRRVRLGLRAKGDTVGRTGRPWFAWEEDYLKNVYPDRTLLCVATVLDRTIHSVSKRAKNLGLTNKYKSRGSRYDYETIETMILDGMSVVQISERTGMIVNNVYGNVKTNLGDESHRQLLANNRRCRL